MDSQYQDSVGQTIPFDEQQFQRRFRHAKKERNGYSHNSKYFDVEIKGDQPYSICTSLEDYILPKLMVMPTSPDRIPGPLSDDDIAYMIEKRQKDRLFLRVQGHLLSGEEVKKRLSGCGIQLSLADTIRIIKKPPIHNYIDMAQEEHALEAKLAKIYIEQSIALGYILKPNETILCSSLESITLPHDVYAIVSSKFSYTQLGLSIELGTSVIQSGHEGRVHFQIKNNTENNICIYPGIQVVQLLLFRTIQPSSITYQDEIGTHAYDSESVSPISKFRKNNDRLSDVKKPGNNFLKSIAEVLRNQVVETIVGAILSIGALAAFATQAETILQVYILPFWHSSPNLIKCLEIALAGSIFSHAFDVIGKLVIHFVERIIQAIREKIR